MIRLPNVDRPHVSVVVVTFWGWDWPLRCLEALVEHTEPVYEVILVDNASPDATGALLADEVEGATLVRNRRNEGFGPAAVRGAGLANGDLLCFLNPDTTVTPGWLGAMRAAIDDPHTGAVVPRFLSEDGSLQEAGSAVDQRGWTHAFGRGGDPLDPRHRFPRYVDYGSAACLLIDRAEFEAAGGFDPAYVPAYCEDVDLCFTLRARGLRTRFEPRATVVHAGAASTDERTARALIERNRRTLVARWGERLADRPRLTDLGLRRHRLAALRDAGAPDRFLVLTDRAPDPADPLGEGLVRLASAPEARVTVVASEADGLHVEALLAAGLEVLPGADPEDLVARRRFHYSALLGGGPELEPALAAWQPQAVRLGKSDISDESALREAAEEVGAATGPAVASLD